MPFVKEISDMLDVAVSLVINNSFNLISTIALNRTGKVCYHYS